MARDYFFVFGSGNPATNASLTPTFITFANSAGTTFTAPSIAEKPPGSGLYTVNYGATQTMAFIMDGATTGLATADRYISGVLDPYDQFGITLNAAYAVGNTTLAGVTLAYGVGLTASTGITLVYGIGLSAIQGITLAYEQGATNFALATTAVAGITLVYGLGLTSTLGITLNYGLGLTNLSGITLNYGLGLTNFTLESAGNTLISALGSTMIGQGLTLTSIGNTLATIGLSMGGLGAVLGTTASSYGSTNIDPVDVMGYLKRSREFNEGNQTYTKATGLLDFYVRGGVTLLIEKTIADNSTNTTKS